MYLYKIYDKIARDYAPSFEANNDEHALRFLKNAIKQGQITPEDHELWCMCMISLNDEDPTKNEFTFINRLIKLEVRSGSSL